MTKSPALWGKSPAQSPLLSGERRGENFTQEREGRSLKVFEKRYKTVIQEGKDKCNMIRNSV